MDNAADAVEIALTPQAPGLGVICNLHRLGLQFSIALKNQVIQRRHANQRRALLVSNKPMDPKSFSRGRGQ